MFTPLLTNYKVSANEPIKQILLEVFDVIALIVVTAASTQIRLSDFAIKQVLKV